MAELNFKQITDKLNSEFTGDTRKLIFWYDANAEFAEDIDPLVLDNAKVLRLEPNNQFYIKYFLERQDTATNYLVYAPFPKPDIRENHLIDTIRYSKEFYADRTSLLCLDLGIPENCKPTVQKHIAFFNNKLRTQAFYALELQNYTPETIEVALMSILCKSKVATFDEVLRCILTNGSFEENESLAEFEKFDLLQAFWRQCESTFGYADSAPSLEKLVMTLFVTYTQKTIHAEVPGSWQPFISYKPGNVLAFLDNMMNSLIYGERFDTLSGMMYQALNAESAFAALTPEDIVDCEVFAEIDEYLLKWIIGRLEAEDVDAKLNGKTIPEICADRRKKHFGKRVFDAYSALENAYSLLLPNLYVPADSAEAAAKNYTDKEFEIDRWYRSFYCFYDKLEDTSAFENLRELVENIYTNEYLDRITVNWSKNFVADEGRTRLDNQLDFYSKYIRFKKERVVVIISDAMRYEVGKSLYDRLLADEKCDVELTNMQSVLPSITAFGMAALLPHKEVTIDNAYTVLCDGLPCASLKQREAILMSAKPNSCCVQFDDIKSLKKDDLRNIIAGKEVVYVYHNQIDARGDKPASENEVFKACEEAIDEICFLIRRLTTTANTSHFIITADHGFLYKRDKLSECNKISGISNAGKRYAIVDAPVTMDGVVNVPIKSYTHKEDEYRFVCSPAGSDVFKTPGSGLNYVHGGCSPQEMIIPVITVHTEKSRVVTVNTSIDLVTLLNKVTNLNINLDFIQKEAVSDTIKETNYRIFFVDGAGNKISNENIYHADNRETEATKRIFKLKFMFRNQTYSTANKYYLVAVDDKTGMETLRREVIMDIAFAGNFGF